MNYNQTQYALGFTLWAGFDFGVGQGYCANSSATPSADVVELNVDFKKENAVPIHSEKNKKLGYRLMVGHMVLVHGIEVRVLVPQQSRETDRVS